jgi:hypothetical protein
MNTISIGLVAGIFHGLQSYPLAAPKGNAKALKNGRISA